MMSTRSLLNFSISYWNIEGVHDKNVGCKIPYINKHLKNDIEILSETWGECDHFGDVENYHVIKIDSKKNKQTKRGRSSGGLLIYFKHHLANFLKVIKYSENHIWVEIDKRFFSKLGSNLLICIAYNPPVNSQYFNLDLIEEMSADILDLPAVQTSPIVIIGDFNARTGDILDYDLNYQKENALSFSSNPHVQRRNCDKTANGEGKKILNLCKSFDLMLLNGRTLGDFWGNFTHYNNNGGGFLNRLVNMFLLLIFAY